MDIFIYLGIFTAIFSLVFLAALIWSINKGQYDDLKGDASRFLMDEKKK